MNLKLMSKYFLINRLNMINNYISDIKRMMKLHENESGTDAFKANALVLEKEQSYAKQFEDELKRREDADAELTIDDIDTIIIDDGITFKGNIDQFINCFGGPGSYESIIHFCKVHGSVVEFIRREK